MSTTYTRRINLFINGKEVRNDIASVRGELAKLTNQQARMVIGSREYNETTKNIQKLKGIMAAHRADIDKTSGSWLNLGKTADKFNRYFGMIGAAVASVTGLALGFRKAIDSFNQFQSKTAELSALTGLLGDDLNWLADQAKKLSVSVDENGIRITASATDILEAFKLMGSAKPELLKNKEALHEVTRQALILAEAAKMEAGPAVEALASIMNQFNAPASEAGKFINVLAAGSKEGAAEVNDLADSIIRSGAAANQAGISIEEEVALIEALAEKGIKAERAGTGLKTMLLKLMAAGGQTSPAVVGMSKALENLAAKNMSAAEMTELFGLESYTVAATLIGNRKRYDELTNAITGTSTALEQAKKNTETNDDALKQARNDLDNQLIAFGEKLNPAFIKSTNLVTYFIKALMAAPKWIKDNQALLIALAGATLAYNAALIKEIALQIQSFAIRSKNYLLDKSIALIATAKVLWMQAELALMRKNTAAQIAHAAALQKNIAMQKLWGGAMLLNPLGIVLAALTAVVLAIKTYDKYNADSIKLEKDKADALTLVKNANDLLTQSYNNNQEQIGQLSKLSATQKRELLEQVDATLSQAEAELVLYEAKKKNIEQDSKPSAWQTLWNSIKAYTPMSGLGTQANFIKLQDKSAAENAVENTIELSDAIKDLRDNLSKIKNQRVDLNEIVNAEKLADEITGSAISQLETKQQYLQTALKNYEAGSEDYIRITKKLEAVNKKIPTNIGGDPGTPTKSTTPIGTEAPETEAPLEIPAWYIQQSEAEALRLAEKKASEEEWTAFLKKQVEEQIDILDEQLKKDEENFEFEKQLTEARKQLKSEYINAIGQVAGALSSMFKEGSAAQIAALAIEKGAAIAQIIFNTAVANSKAVAASPLTAGQPWVAINTVSAVASIASIVATTISSFKDKKNNNKPGYAEGKYPLTTGMHGDKPHMALFNEVPGQPEMVVDGITTKKLMINYPEIIRAIYQVRDGRAPQYAEGKYPQSIPLNPPSPGGTGTGAGGISPEDARALTAAIQEFMKWKPAMSVELFEKKQMQFQQIKDDNKL